MHSDVPVVLILECLLLNLEKKYFCPKKVLLPETQLVEFAKFTMPDFFPK